MSGGRARIAMELVLCGGTDLVVLWSCLEGYSVGESRRFPLSQGGKGRKCGLPPPWLSMCSVEYSRRENRFSFCEPRLNLCLR